MARYLLAHSPQYGADRLSSVTSEAGPGPRAPVEESVAGYLRLKGTGTPDSDADLHLELATGGNAAGFDPTSNGQASGAQLLHKTYGAADSTLNGYDNRSYLNYIQAPSGTTKSSSDSYTAPSSLRELSSGDGGFAVYHDQATDEIAFFYKTTRTGAWTKVVIFTDGDDGLDLPSPTVKHRVGLVDLPDGTLIVYFLVADTYTGGTAVAAYNSSDDGATWALLNRNAAVVPSDQDMLCVEEVNGDVVLVTGDQDSTGINIYQSTSAGATFAQLGGENATYARPCICKHNGLVIILADDDSATSDVFQIAVAPGGVIDDDNDWTATTMEAAASSGNRSRCIVPDDDGTLWVYTIQNPNPCEMNVYASTDGGNTWVNASPDTSSSAFGYLGHGAATEYPQFMSGGVHRGLMTVLSSQTTTTTPARQLYAFNFGGWTPTVTERPLKEDSGEPFKACYIAGDTPDVLGWTKTDVSTGATISLTGGACRIAGGASVQTYYKAPAAWLTEIANASPNQVRFNFLFKVDGTTNEDMTTDRAVIYVAPTAGSANQWFKIRFGDDNIAVYDNSGALANTGFSFGTHAFTDWTELKVAMVVGGGAAANTGLLSVWYRTRGTAVWTRLLDNQDVAEDSGTTTQAFDVGGKAAGAITWDWMFLGLVGDHGSQASFTDQTDLRGRPLGALPTYIDSGYSVSAYGVGGVSGDSWRLRPDFDHAAGPMLVALSRVRHWRSTAETDQTIVLDAGANNLFMSDLFAFFGTNFYTCSVQANATDSWSTPSVDTTIDARIHTGVTATATGKGFVTASATWVPKQFASQEGRRYFIRFQTGGNAYEIADNDAGRIYVADTDLSSESGDFDIYPDAMFGEVAVSGYRFVRFKIPTQDTADDYFRIARVMAGMKTSMTEGTTEVFNVGFLDRVLPNVTLQESSSGQVFTDRRGNMRRALQLSWVPNWNPNNDWDQDFEALYRHLGGPLKPVAVIRDSTVTHLDASNGGLYQIRGWGGVRNVHKNSSGELRRVEPIELVEVP
jgi:hypothetical protein